MREIKIKREYCYNEVLKAVKECIVTKHYLKDGEYKLINHLRLRKSIFEKIKELDESTCGETESQYLKMRLLKEEKVIVLNFADLKGRDMYPRPEEKMIDKERYKKVWTAEELYKLNHKEDLREIT